MKTSWFFEEINKSDKLLARLRKKERKSILLKSEMKSGNITFIIEIKRDYKRIL